MGFYERAWNSAADKYGMDRSEKYGRVARFGRLLQLAGIVVLVVLVSLAVSGTWG